MYAESSEAVSLLRQNGADLDPVDAGGWSALSLAVDSGNLDVVSRLLSLGASTRLSGALATRHGSLIELCRGQLDFFRKHGDPIRAAPMISGLDAILSLLTAMPADQAS